MTHRILLTVLLTSALISSCKNSTTEKTPSLPNVVIIYTDDLGYGDVGAYGSEAIPTPNIDALAAGGLRFTDGHATSATCTPSRYALLTGTYPWRKKGAHVLPGDAPLLIDTAMTTLPDLMKTKGYTTGIVGKWHLGLGSGDVDWNQEISPGPNQLGFDYSYILAATQDRVPCVYIQNGHVVNLDPDDPIEVNYKENFPGEPTGKENPELLTTMYDHGHDMSIVNGISRIGFMKGGKSALWVDEDMADVFTDKASEFVVENKDRPFFLYFALHQPHVPRTPNARFVGQTELGPRGDVIVESDWCVGQIVELLREQGLIENTLILFSSDNGPVLQDGYVDYAEEKNGEHKPSGPYRGGKYSLYEGGTRVPFITYWEGTIAPGVSDALVSQLDYYNSLASLVGSVTMTEDSQDLLDVFLGKSKTGRPTFVEEASTRTSYRKGQWKLIPPYEGPAVSNHTNVELGRSGELQLYNLADDPGEQKNLAQSEREKLSELITDYQKETGNVLVELMQ